MLSGTAVFDDNRRLIDKSYKILVRAGEKQKYYDYRQACVKNYPQNDIAFGNGLKSYYGYKQQRAVCKRNVYYIKQRRIGDKLPLCVCKRQYVNSNHYNGNDFAHYVKYFFQFFHVLFSLM
jgi:hypothetical protein